MRAPSPLAVRLYRTLSIVLPARFRRERGAAMLAMFEEEWRERRGLARVTLLIRALIDLVRTAVLERLDAKRSRSAGRHGWAFSWLDLRLGVRLLRKQPLLTAVSIVSLALGIPAGLAPSHVFDALEKPMAVDGGERLRILRYRSVETSARVLPTSFDLDLWRSLGSLETVGGVRLVERNLDAGNGAAVGVITAEVSGSMFRLLNARPLLGRTLDERDAAPGAPSVVVLGEDLWRARLASDSGAVGRTVWLAGEPHTVVGIMPRGFGFPVRQQVWLPMRETLAAEPGVATRIDVYGRLAEGASAETARAELDALRRGLTLEYPDVYEQLRAEVVPNTVAARMGSPDGRIRGSPEVWLIQGLGLLLLLVTCINVGLLILARAATRSSELAVRTALGATRSRIVGQVFAEALVLAALSAGLGLLLLHTLGTRYFETIRVWVAANVPYGFELGITWRTALRALVLSVLSAAAASLVPALRVTGKAVGRNLQRSAPGGAIRFGRLSTALVAADVALAVAAVGVAVGVGQRMGPALAQVFEPGVAAEEYLVGRIRLPASIGPFESDTAADVRTLRRASIERTLVARLREDPRVRGVAVGSALPGMDYSRRNVEVEQRTHAIDQGWVVPGFFDGLGRPLLAGRDFGPADLEGERRAVIVNAAFVQNVLVGGSPLGRQLRYPSDGEDAPFYEIVGVAPDLGMDPLNPSGGAGVYHPVAPGGLDAPWVAVHVGPNAVSYLPRFRELLAEVDPSVILDYPSTLDDWGPGDDRLVMLIMAAGSTLLASILLALAASSIYAIMAFTVAQRTREIGVRAALGARPHEIVATIGRRAALQLGIGVLVGMPAAGRLYYLTQENPATGLASVVAAAVVPSVGVLLLLALVACGAPVARALRIKPTVAMRAE